MNYHPSPRFLMSLCLGVACASAHAQTSGLITSCVSKLTGVSRIVAASSSCNAASENVFTWNQQGPAGPTGLPGQPGTYGTNGANGVNGVTGTSVLQGTAAPSAGAGNDGDTYLNETTGDVYAQANGAWALTGNVRGPQGIAGLQGLPGTDGASGSNGTNGANGSNGANGTSLLQGTSSPTSTTGSNGDTYLNVASGEVFTKTNNLWTRTGIVRGPRGPQGANGVDGANGAQGPGGAAGTSFSATSNSTQPLLIGTRTFQVPAGLAYVPGSSIRASTADLSYYLEGMVTSYSGTTLTMAAINSNYVPNPFTPILSSSQWIFSLVGTRGVPGAKGDAGSVGPVGPTGPQGPAGPAGPIGPTAYTYLANNVMPDAVGVYITLDGIGNGVSTDGDLSIDQQHALIEPVMIAPPVACTVSGVTFTVYSGSPNSVPMMYVNRTVMIGSTPQISFVTNCTLHVNAQGTGSCTTPVVGSNLPYQYLSATVVTVPTMPNGHVFTRFTCQ